MRKKLLNNKLKIALVLICILLLAAIRSYEEILFYDPFLEYFKGDYLNLAFPKYDGWKLFFGLSSRYFLNTIVSLSIIYILFKDLDLTKFAALLYLIFFVILITAFFGLLNVSDNYNYFILFYVRRFLIQPLFVLLFIPAFYYQRQTE
jgi:exosortase F-associated protein